MKDKDKEREYQREYARTEKRKAVKRRYNQSEKGRERNNLQNAKWRAANRDKLLRSYKKCDLKRHYGLTFEAYEAMFVRQEQKCASCGSPFPGRKNGQWCIDHDHSVKKPHARAIICNGCNLILGHAKDSIPRLQMLAGYLERINDRIEIR